jgi:YD repeat-containing protein
MLALFPLASRAEVDLKDGSYEDSLIDIFSAEKNTYSNFIRFYNSRATQEGWFGFGWGSAYQTKLIISKEGNIRVLENGLESEGEFILSNPSLGIYSLQSQIIKKTPKGYTREFPKGRVDYFNKNGRLEKIVFSESLAYLLNYNSKNKLLTVTSNGHKKYVFDWYDNGKIKSITSNDQKTSYYFYDESSNMIKSIDEKGSVHLYEYDMNHNLTKIVLPDQRKRILKYDKNSFVTEYINENSEVIHYQYESDPQNSKYHYWTNVLKGNNKELPILRHEYEIKLSKDGRPYTYRQAITINGSTTDTVFSECCGLPVKITKGSDVVTLDYNSKNQLITKKFSNGTFINLEYDEKTNKIIKATGPDGWTKFSYTKNKKLSGAVGSKTESVDLVYDTTESIIKTILYKKSLNSPKQKMNLFYDSKGQVIKVELEKVGEAFIIYKENGQLELKTEKTGTKEAKEIDQVFASFLSLLGPVFKI